MAYRITTVSRCDGKPTTKKFTSEPQALEVWQQIRRNSMLYAFAQLYEVQRSGYSEHVKTLDGLK